MMRLIISYLLVLFSNYLFSQAFVEWDAKGWVTQFSIPEPVKPQDSIPLVTFILDDQAIAIVDGKSTEYGWHVGNKLSVRFIPNSETSGQLGEFVFKNLTEDTLKLQNVVLFGASTNRYHITGYGDHWLSRTRLFRPGESDVPVILPDNAWELGYSDVPLAAKDMSVYGLIRRKEWTNARRRRFETYLYPGGSVTYQAYAETYKGKWQEGLRKAFQERYLYDLEDFEDSLFQRDDLDWIRNQYVIHLIMAWDHIYYDTKASSFRLQEFIDRGKKWYGGDDVIGLWPTWPALGIDPQNQWDLFRNLPGGLTQMRSMVDNLHSQDIRFFICYNPWDESTRLEDHLGGMASLIQQIDADGVVLDTRGSSSYAIQRAADSVRSGVVMYSEGMAVPKDMPGIVSGRVHNALYYPPLLNLNKFIRPDFAIFRVAELKYEPIRREYNISLFNGHGVEINMFSPGQPSWIEDDYRHLGRVARILRENSENFNSISYTPLYPSLLDSVYINYWPGENKNVYTFFSLIPEGVYDDVMELKLVEDQHLVDIWNHEELIVDKDRVRLKMDTFHKSWLGTNNEGAVSAIAVFRNELDVEINGNILNVSAQTGDSILIWKDDPAYEKESLGLAIGTHQVNLPRQFPRYEGKLVIQLKAGTELIDEKIVTIKPGTPFRISKVNRTKPVRKAPNGMVLIPGGNFEWKITQGHQFIGYPEVDTASNFEMTEFYMDKYPVTNAQYKVFLDKNGYWPEDDHHFLKHWVDGSIPRGMEDFPVVNVSYVDAQAYAEWAGKRLPTELEWQYAAQTTKKLDWPWGMEFDSTMTNTGDGIPYAVGLYANGKNTYGLEDLTGQVWQLTHDVYESGSYRYGIVKGGSHFKPTSSWWYVQGGPKPLTHRQILLMVSDGFDRKTTVGFRCVVDSQN